MLSDVIVGIIMMFLFVALGLIVGGLYYVVFGGWDE